MNQIKLCTTCNAGCDEYCECPCHPYKGGRRAEIIQLISVLTKVESWLDGVRNERDRTRFEQRWNDLQDEAAELRVLILRVLA